MHLCAGAIPPVLSWIPYLSYFSYAFEALAVNEASGLIISDTVGDVSFTVRVLSCLYVYVCVCVPAPVPVPVPVHAGMCLCLCQQIELGRGASASVCVCVWIQECRSDLFDAVCAYVYMFL
jgi:hypothetical protein